MFEPSGPRKLYPAPLRRIAARTYVDPPKAAPRVEILMSSTMDHRTRVAAICKSCGWSKVENLGVHSTGRRAAAHLRSHTCP